MDSKFWSIRRDSWKLWTKKAPTISTHFLDSSRTEGPTRDVWSLIPPIENVSKPPPTWRRWTSRCSWDDGPASTSAGKQLSPMRWRDVDAIESNTLSRCFRILLVDLALVVVLTVGWMSYTVVVANRDASKWDICRVDEVNGEQQPVVALRRNSRKDGDNSDYSGSDRRMRILEKAIVKNRVFKNSRMEFGWDSREVLHIWFLQ